MEHSNSQMERARGVSEHETRRVLLAEDDADFRTLLAQTLRRQGYDVTECVDGPGLASKLGTYVLFGPPVGFDLVVSDIRVPGATALEILEAMRECEGVPPVILITAFGDRRIHAAVSHLGAAVALEKPFEKGRLMAEIQRLRAQDAGAANLGVPVDPP